MGVELKEVEHIAKLANLALSSDELQEVHKELEKILEFVSELTSASVGQRSESETAISTPERPDIVLPSLSTEKFLPQAPAVSGSAFQVPRIIEQDH